MIDFQLENLGKRFENHWIFRRLTHTFQAQKTHAIVGANGSGKSSLLKVLSGQSTASEGSLIWRLNGATISPEDMGRHVAFASPYIELTDGLTLQELISFQQQVKGFIDDFPVEQIVSMTELTKSKDQLYDTFSSGMKQRVKLALAVFSNSSVLMLDEPHANLDQSGRDWLTQLIRDYRGNRTTFVCTNHDPVELSYCDTIIDIRDHKAKNKKPL